MSVLRSTLRERRVPSLGPREPPPRRADVTTRNGQLPFADGTGGDGVLDGFERVAAKETITANHYAHSVPSGKSVYVAVGDALFVFAIPANRNIGPFLLGGSGGDVWELARMWAPDHHDVVLTQAISRAVRLFRGEQPQVCALVSYADPNVGHEGGVYRAASWVYTGQSAEGRYYLSRDGQVVARRKFHSGSRNMSKAEIEALGYVECKRPGKHRFVKGLDKTTRRIIRSKWGKRSR